MAHPNPLSVAMAQGSITMGAVAAQGDAVGEERVRRITK